MGVPGWAGALGGKPSQSGGGWGSSRGGPQAAPKSSGDVEGWGYHLHEWASHASLPLNEALGPARNFSCFMRRRNVGLFAHGVSMYGHLAPFLLRPCSPLLSCPPFDLPQVAGVELKHQPPPDSAQPDKHWRMYVFKGEALLQEEMLYLHRWAGALGVGHGLGKGCACRAGHVVGWPCLRRCCGGLYTIWDVPVTTVTTDAGSTPRDAHPQLPPPPAPTHRAGATTTCLAATAAWPTCCARTPPSPSSTRCCSTGAPRGRGPTGWTWWVLGACVGTLLGGVEGAGWAGGPLPECGGGLPIMRVRMHPHAPARAAHRTRLALVACAA